MKQSLVECAKSLGFSDVYVTRPEPLSDWRGIVDARPDLSFIKLSENPLSVLPECKSVVLMVWPYHPYELEPKQAAFSAYYVASNASHQAARKVGDWIAAQGFQAAVNPPIPHKPLAARVGAGRYGRNGVIAVASYGSRVSLQCVLTDAQLEPGELADPNGFSDECKNCTACRKACPVGALAGDGSVNANLCLRALPMDAPYPEDARTLIGASLIGCDICQDCCRRNRNVKRAPVPWDAQALLRQLLRGEPDGLPELIGPNYARKKRLQARACLVAANLNETGCLPLIEPLLHDDSELVRDAARWAVARLSG